MAAIEDLSYQDYLRIFRRRWKLAAMGAVIGLIGGWLAARVQTPVPIYSGLAVVSYNPFTGFEVSPGAVPPEQSRELSGQVLFIRGPQVLGEAARRLGMIPADTPREKFTDFLPALDQLNMTLLVNPDPAKQSNMIHIYSLQGTADRAAEVANAVAESYKETNLDELRKFVVKRRGFLERELKENERELNRAQLAYEEYRREHPMAAFQPGQQIAEEEARARTLAAKIQETQRQLEMVHLGRPVSDLGLIAIVGAMSTTRLTQLSTQYTNLQLQRSQMLGELTSEHPMAKAKQQEIERVRQGLADELSLILEAFEKQQTEAQKQAEDLRKLEKDLPAEAQQLAHLTYNIKVFENLGLQLGAQLGDTMLKDTGITGQVQVVSPARPSPFPINPPAYGRTVLTGIAAGAFAGLLLGVLLETSRFSARKLRQIESSLDLPVLGINPRMSPEALARWLPSKRAPVPDSADWSRAIGLANLLAPRSAMSEAIRALRAGLQGALDAGQGAFTICATVPGEGATTTAINLALSFAQAGKRVLLIESDLRSPAISRILGLDREPGFTDLLQQATDLERATRNVADFVTGALTVDQVLLAPGVDQLHVIPCGQKTGSAVELLGSAAFSATLAAMRARYEVILFDGPALSTGADSILLGKQTAVVVVFCPSKTEPRQLESSVLQLRKSDCKVVGLFVNAMEEEPGAATEPAALAESA
jgi:succinoglycan biosynthesis transport protein ExoP